MHTTLPANRLKIRKNGLMTETFSVEDFKKMQLFPSDKYKMITNNNKAPRHLVVLLFALVVVIPMTSCDAASTSLSSVANEIQHNKGEYS